MTTIPLPPPGLPCQAASCLSFPALQSPPLLSTTRSPLKRAGSLGKVNTGHTCEYPAHMRPLVFKFLALQVKAFLLFEAVLFVHRCKVEEGGALCFETFPIAAGVDWVRVGFYFLLLPKEREFLLRACRGRKCVGAVENRLACVYVCACVRVLQKCSFVAQWLPLCQTLGLDCSGFLSVV